MPSLTVDDVVKHFANAARIKETDRVQTMFGDVGIRQPLIAEDCELWAKEHWPECFEALRSKDDVFYKKCIGGIIRRRTKENVKYLWKLIELDATQVLRYSPFIGRFSAQGYVIPPPDRTWSEYTTWMQALG